MRILLIEDEAKVASFIRRALEEESYAIDVCADGTEGLELARAAKDGRYDLIILDRMLPGLSGLEILKALRKEQIPAPVLILTARSQVDQKVKGLDAGADDYLTKPFAVAELLAAYPVYRSYLPEGQADLERAVDTACAARPDLADVVRALDADGLRIQTLELHQEVAKTDVCRRVIYDDAHRAFGGMRTHIDDAAGEPFVTHRRHCNQHLTVEIAALGALARVGVRGLVTRSCAFPDCGRGRIGARCRLVTVVPRASLATKFHGEMLPDCQPIANDAC